MLEKYWPEADQVNACIKNEAETADVSVLLAVHCRFRRSRPFVPT